jgi:hypothetical protein
MDDRNNVWWQIRIISGTTEHYVSNDWIPLNTNLYTLDLTTIGLPNSTTVRHIQVRYRDSLWNTSDWFLDMGRIRFQDNARHIWAIHDPLQGTGIGGAVIEQDFFGLLRHTGY